MADYPNQFFALADFMQILSEFMVDPTENKKMALRESLEAFFRKAAENRLDQNEDDL
jgi:hypothetical protein